MTWLLALYPPRWRRRYGDELRALIDSQRFSFATVVDLIAGAIDAWLAPQRTTQSQPAVADGEKGKTMTARSMKLACAGYGPHVTRADEWKSAGVMLGGTIVLTALWMWLKIRTGDHPYVEAFAVMPFLVPYLISMKYTYLKGRAPATQIIFIGGMVLLLALVSMFAGWISVMI